MEEAEKLKPIIDGYVEERKRANAYYALYKDHLKRMEYHENILKGELGRMTKPLSTKEKNYLIDIIKGEES